MNSWNFKYYLTIYTPKDKEKILKLFNIIPFSEELIPFTFSENKLQFKNFSFEIFLSCYSQLLELDKKINITSILIFNNAFSSKNNNNQL